MRSLNKEFIILLLISLLGSYPTFSHNTHTQDLDSLLYVISLLSGEEKLDAYDKLYKTHMDNLSDSTSMETFLTVSTEYAAEARLQNDIKRQGDIMLNNLIASVRMNRHNEVDEQIEKTLAFLKEHDLTDAMYMAHKQQILSDCRRGMYENALANVEAIFRQAQQQNNNESMFYMQYLMGLVYMYQDRLSEAEQHYRKSIEISEKIDISPFGLIGVYLECSNMLQATGQIDEFFDMAEEAEKIIDNMIKENPDNQQQTNKINLWTLYAYAYSFLGDFDETERYCNKIDSLQGTDLVSLGNTSYLRSMVWESRKDYDRALDYINQAIEIDPTYSHAWFRRVKILSLIENAPLTWAETKNTITHFDSLRKISYNMQLDDLHTRYEVDQHIADKQKARSLLYFLFAISILLLIVLCIWFIYNSKITKKNRTLAKQIKELLAQKEKEETILFNEIDLGSKDGDSYLSTEKQKEELSAAIRNILIKEKAYRDPGLTRDRLIERLGTNKKLFTDAFHNYFGTSYAEYITSLRLKEALILLDESDLTIEEISEKVGFGTVRTLQRQFQSKYNMSPKEYRKAAIS